MDLLSWFIEVWFCQQWFAEAQESGHVPDDEPFMPYAVASIPGLKNSLPLWLSATTRTEIQTLYAHNVIAELCPGQVIGKHSSGNYHAICFVRMDADCGVLVETAMRGQNFPVSEVEALDEIVTTQLYERLLDALKDREFALPASEIQGRINQFCSDYKTVRVFGSSRGYHIPTCGF